MELDLRALDPVDTVSGVQARLRNLGYAVPEVNGKLDAATRAALERFRADQKLPASRNREIDGELSAALKRVYGH